MKNKKILDINEQTIHIYKDCFDINGSPKKTENIKWQFLKNPKQKSIVDIAFDEEKDRVEGIYAVFCLDFKVGDKTIIGAQSVDTITDVNYRGQGLFIKLASDVYQKASERGFGFVYGFPNGNSIYGFKRKLSWEVLDPMPFLIKPLKSKYFTNKIKLFNFLPNINLSFTKYNSKSNFVIEEDDNFPEEVNLIWAKFSKDIKVAIVRDKRYLEWRYNQKPNEDYKIAHCYNSDKTYLGYVVFVVKEKHGGKIGYIMELIYNLENPKAGNQLMKYAIDKIKKQDADCILSWCLEHSPNHKIFKKQIFLKMPEKLRPIELHFGALTFKENLANILYKRKNWYISYSDSDTV
ncbi:GNAT family N-acetyltransferase [Lutibacter sp.]